MDVLREGGWIMPGVPPVDQVLADARRFSDELVLTKLVARVFRTLILGGLVIPETPQAMNWMRSRTVRRTRTFSSFKRNKAA